MSRSSITDQSSSDQQLEMQKRTRVCCPYGGFSAIPVIFALLGCLFSILSCYGCDTFTAQLIDNTNNIGYFLVEDINLKYNNSITGYVVDRCILFPPTTTKIAADHHDNNNNNNSFNNNNNDEGDNGGFIILDRTWRFFRVMAALLPIMGILCLIIVCTIISCCCNIVYRPKYVIIIGIIIIHIGLGHLLLLTGLLSNVCNNNELDCIIGPGGYFAIFATICFMIVAFSLFCCCLRERPLLLLSPYNNYYENNDQQQCYYNYDSSSALLLDNHNYYNNNNNTRRNHHHHDQTAVVDDNDNINAYCHRIEADAVTVVSHQSFQTRPTFASDDTTTY